MKKIFRHLPELVFAVSTVFMLSLSCYLGWPAGEDKTSGFIRTEQIITDEQIHYNILFGPLLRLENLTWEDAAAARCAAATLESFVPDHVSC